MKYNFDYITNYIMEYDPGVPKSIIWGALVTVCGIIILLSFTSTNGKIFIKNTAWSLFIGYLFLMTCATILFRETSETMRYSLCPFVSYTELYDKLLAQLILNVGMFVPIGFLLGVTVKKMNTLKILEIGCLLSLTIEIIQLVSRRGVFNVDDIIHNTLGCVIGYGVFRLCNSILTAYTK